MRRLRLWHRAGENAFQWLTPLFLGLRIRQRLARQHLVALGGVVYKDRFDRRNLLQVAGLQSFHDILVGVVGAAFVIQIVLDELEARNPDSIEAQVIGTACIAIRNGGDAQILQRRDPLSKNRRNGRVTLRVDAADFARAIVHIEIRRDQLLFRLHFQRTRRAPHELRQCHLIRRG